MAKVNFIFCLIGFCIVDVLAENKRMLISGQDVTQLKLQNIETKLQDLQNKVTTQEQTIMTQGQMLTTQLQTITNQEHTIMALERKVMEQEANTTAQQQTIKAQQTSIAKLQKKLLEQEGNITTQQVHVLQQESLITAMTNNLTDVLSHNFFDEMAQSMCSAATDHNAYVYAIRRDCKSGHAPTCSSICSNASSQMRHNNNDVECFDAFQIQKTHAHLDANPGWKEPNEGQPFMYVYRYLTSYGCSYNTACGPNYCCCRSSG